MADITNGLFALGGVAITLIGQYFLGGRAHRQQMERDGATYARQVTDAKRERLIRRYEAASRAATSYYWALRKAHVMGKSGMVPQGIVPQTAADEFLRANTSLLEAEAELAIEGDNADVIELCARVRRTGVGVLSSTPLQPKDLEQMDSAVEALRKALESHLKALDEVKTLNPIMESRWLSIGRARQSSK